MLSLQRAYKKQSAKFIQVSYPKTISLTTTASRGIVELQRNIFGDDTMIPTITTQQIQIFLTVTDAGGFAKAAPLLFMTQSAVSKAVSRLEQQLGFPLFERTTRLFALTEHGKRLYDLWSIHIQELEDMIERISAAERQKANEITVGVVNTVRLESFLWDIIDRFKAQCPETVVNIESEAVAAIVPKFLNHEFDMIFAPDFVRFSLDDADMPWKWAAKDHAQLIMPQTNPLAQKESVYLSDLRDEAFVSIDDTVSADYYKDFSEKFSKTGFVPKIGKKYKTASSIKSIHRAKDALILTDSYFDYDLLGDSVKVPVVDCMNGIICSWQKDAENQNLIDELTHTL